MGCWGCTLGERDIFEGGKGESGAKIARLGQVGGEKGVSELVLVPFKCLMKQGPFGMLGVDLVRA